MDVFEPNLPALLVFVFTWGVFCAGVVHVAGMLPLSSAPDGVRSPVGVLLVLLNVAMLAGLLALTLAHSYGELRWSSAVVVGGMIFLFSPFIVQDLPDRLKNGVAGMALLALLLIAALAVLLSGGAHDHLLGMILPIVS